MRFQLIKFTLMDVTRYGEETYVKGRPVKGEPEIIQRNLKVQPIRPTEVQAFTESDRNKSFAQVFCQEADLRELQQGEGGWSADEFTWQGYVYEIYKEEWHDPSACIPHGRYIAVRKEVTPN